jgi:hypothetical protein
MQKYLSIVPLEDQALGAAKKCEIHLLGQQGSDKEYCGDSRVRLLSTFSTVSHQSEQP